MQEGIGKKVIDISAVLEMFQAQEGIVQHIIGKTGMGKTYEATRRALIYLYGGHTVYTTWKLKLPEYYDERDNPWIIIRNLLTFRSDFFRFELHKNWHYVDLRKYEKDGVFDTEKFAAYLASLNNCIFFLDEGQDTFDSHSRASKVARQSITRSRHMQKTLIIISQRAQAVDINARANVTYFYKCVKTEFPIPFLPPYFKVFRTDEIDEANNYPLWLRHDSQGRVIWQADLWYKGFAKKAVYNSYDSWYMSEGQSKSQQLHINAYKLNFLDRFVALFLIFLPKKLSTRYIHVYNLWLDNVVQYMNETIKNFRRWKDGQTLGERGEKARESVFLRVKESIAESKKAGRGDAILKKTYGKKRILGSLQTVESSEGTETFEQRERTTAR